MNTFKVSLLIIVLINWLPAAAQKKDSARQKAVSFAGLPMISYNASLGWSFGANGMIFFNMKKTDTISPASMVGVRGTYTSSKSYFGGAYAQLYFKEDKWRATLAGGLGNINFQYYELADGMDEGDFVDYNTTTDFLFLRGLRKIKGHFYGGAYFKLQHSETLFKDSAGNTQEVAANGFGLNLTYDSRNYIYYPSSGFYSSLSFLNNAAWLGTDSVFSTLRFFVNWYHTLSKNSILAARVNMFSGLGNVPFSGQRAVGGKDIRGYTDGKYRGDQIYSAQAEYRWNFYKRWGVVGFFGMAFTEKPSSELLPAGGVGARFTIIRSRHINIGVDYAVGKGDQGIYFRINEAF